MSKNKKEAIQDNEPTGELTREERIEEIDKLVSTLDETLEVFKKQLDESQDDLKGADEKQTEQLEEILDKLPKGATPAGVLQDILQAATPKRTQILNNISKLQASIKIETIRKNKLEIEKRKIEEAIKEDGLNELTERLCETFKTTLDQYITFEDTFLTFKEKAAELGILDRMFFNRVDNEKFPKWYREVFGLTLMTASSLQGLTPNHFINTIQEIGENPLKARKYIREETKPIHRDITGKTEEPEGPDSAAADKLAEVFDEPGPRVPRY